MHMNVKQITDAIGGCQTVASATGRPIADVHNWRSRNTIPAIYWPAISRMPQAKRAGVTLEVLEQSGKKDRNA